MALHGATNWLSCWHPHFPESSQCCQFMTAGLKEYPPALCKALGDSFGTVATSYPPCDSPSESDFHDFVTTCRKLESRDFSLHMGKNFHG